MKQRNMNRNLFIEILTRHSLESAEDGRRLFAMMEEAAPSWKPRRWGYVEPIRNKWDPTCLEQVWDFDDRLDWVGEASSAMVGGVSKRSQYRSHSNIKLSTDPASVDLGAVAELLRQMADTFDADYGFVHLLTRPDPVRAFPDTAYFDLVDGEPYMYVVPQDLRVCLPDLYWANLFGPPYVDLFGADRLASAPAYLVEQLGPERFYLQLSKDPRDLETSYDQVSKARAAVKAHLGLDAFWDPSVRQGGHYRAADLTKGANGPAPSRAEGT